MLDPNSGPAQAPVIPLAQPAPSTLLRSTGSEDAHGLPNPANAQAGWAAGDIGGEYQISSDGKPVDAGALVAADGNRANVALSTDARLVVDNTTAGDAVIRLGCRVQTAGTGYSGYSLAFAPSTNAWSLDRFDLGIDVPLSGIQYAPGAPLLYDTHRLTLTCSGDTLSASIDGRMVGSLRDGAYPDGEAMVGAGMFTRSGGVLNVPDGSVFVGTVDARFGNLSFSQP